ncbi:hypothetical protein SAMN05216517_10990 [Janthinobacterium sp. OK676]|uniref:hypothetical protein n=1 Tax=Janthinobacterium sp. OK676 TaxID=1855295 RepID=UPI00088CBDD6|nr:hypothetical protein [Janthinobacterium sp. OK676]SDN24499.1 hypothetical protein SAMN05216517_10990 [Janthinobacterium sp. OK676]
MFNFFKKPLPPSPLESQPKPRAVLPTYVTDKVVVLSKAGPSIRNTYEIRLALFMAKSRNLRFILAVRPCTLVETSVRDLLAEHDGLIEETQMGDFCVSVGWGYEEGENEGWVLGDAAALAALVGEVRSGRLREFLIPGGRVAGADLTEMAAELRQESLSATNIDKEPVQEALLSLIANASRNGGTLFIQ